MRRRGCFGKIMRISLSSLNMNNEPFISIIVPVFNAQEFLRETLKSIRAQTYQNWEALIIDDRSTDLSVAIIKSFVKIDCRFKLLFTAVNSGGPATPRNIGIEHARGKYIAFLDADDIWLHKKLTRQIMQLENNPALKLTCSKLTLIDEHGVEFTGRSVYYKALLKRLIRIPQLLFFNNYIATSTVLLTKSEIGDLRFEEHTDFIAVEDWGFWMRFVKQHHYKGIGYCESALVQYRVLEQSISHDNPIKFRAANLALLKYFKISGYITWPQYWLGRLGRLF